MDHARVPPRQVRLHLLEEITDNFSEERKLGAGAFGSVYEGQLKDGEKIAIKKLHSMPGLNDEQFERECLNLASLQHQNIVKLIGYCHETRKELVEIPGTRRTILADNQHMMLCFEYMCNGSLANYLQDESTGEDWHTRYAIIKGICKGLKYLHVELNHPVYHLDLKPDNILLDGQMTPKIADFGLSKLFGDERTRVSTSAIGTIGYMPPEYIEHNLISNKLDIFSLGVIIIKLMMGSAGYSQAADMSSEEFIELTHGKWRQRLQRTSNDAIELYAEQVKTCIKIALSCVEVDRHKRPNIGDIISELDDTETTAQFSHALTINRGSTAVEEEEEMRPYMSTKNKLVDAPKSKENVLLNVYPRQLRFPFFEPNKSNSCPLLLSNNTDADVAFRIIHPKRYIDGLLNLSGIVPPRSTRTYLVLLEKQPPAGLDKFDVILQSCIAHKDRNDIVHVHDNFIPDIIELTEGNKLQEVTLMAAIFYPVGAKMTSKIICRIIDYQCHIVAMDTHPTKQWILAGHDDGSIKVWNYDTKETYFDFNVDFGILSIIFVARKQWIVAGGKNGEIQVTSWAAHDKVIKKFQPHSALVSSLAVHPNLPLLLSASYDKLIKLWDWEKSWECLWKFENSPCFETSIRFNPNNDSTDSITFTSVSVDGIAKIWKTSHHVPIATYDCKSNLVLCFDHFPQAGGGEYIVTGTETGKAQVWDLVTQKCVQEITELQIGHGYNVCVVDRSPDPSLLVVALQDNTVGLYNPATCRYENILMHNFGRIRKMVYIKSKISVAVAHEGGLAILEIH